MNETIEYIPCKTIVSSTKNKYWFATDFNMNIYRGCSHGCIYCDSRSECYRDDTFYRVKVKENALKVIENDIKNKRVKGIVGTGSMSDPYNPLEEKLELTREALKLLDSYGYGVAIATKSPLITRDIDIIKSISTHSPVLIKMTITTTDDKLSQKIESNIDISSKRFAALKELADNDIYSGILFMPVLPFITDTVENVETLVEKATESKVKFIYPGFGMTLRDRQRLYYYEKLDELFPGIKEQYKRTYGNQYSCGTKQAKMLFQNLVLACDKNSILYKMGEIITAYQKAYEIEQLSLF